MSLFAFRFRSVQARLHGSRAHAAAVLYRLTGDTDYRDIFHTEVDGSTYGAVDYLNNASQMLAVAEYAKTTWPSVDATIQTNRRNSLLTSAALYFSTPYGSIVHGFSTFRQYTALSLGFGFDGQDWNLCHLLMNAYFIAEDVAPGDGETYRKIMEDGFNYILGANLIGKSMVTGLGSWQPNQILHNDSQGFGAAGGGHPPKGITVYGPVARPMTKDKVFESHYDLAWTTMNSSTAFTTNYEQEKQPYPYMTAWPFHEFWHESPGLIECSEYVYGGSIGPQQWIASALWATNGQLRTTYSTDVPSGKTRATARTRGTVLSSLTLDGLGPFKASGTVSCDTDDTTVYWISSSSATEPTPQQIAAGNDHTGSAAIASGSFTMDDEDAKAIVLDGLDAETAQTIHMVPKDASNVFGAVISDSVTTIEYIPFAVAYVGGAVSTSDASSYTWDNSGSHYSIGTANSQRKVALATSARWGTASNIMPTSVTIKPTGESDVVADLVAGLNFTGNAAGHNFLGFYDDLVTAGTTADFAVAWDQTSLRSHFDAWTVSGAQPDPVGYSANTASSLGYAEVEVTIPTGGVALVSAYGIAASAPSGVVITANGVSTGVTEETGADAIVESSVRKTAARVTTEGTVTIRATFTGGTVDTGIAVVVYEPY